jgi:GNAT superfamily N-acetyltransferase
MTNRNAGSLDIVQARLGDVDDIVPLLDGYRMFYEQKSDPAACRAYLIERMSRGEAWVFLARDPAAGGRAIGFVLLYRTFTTVTLRHLWILNDLFVDPKARTHGAGRALMQRAEEFARASGALRLDLRTARTNTTAQSLYRSCGWKQDETFLRFSKDV